MNTQVTIALPTRCSLGEGLHWDGRRNLLWFVDVYGPHVFWFDPDTRRLGKRVVPQPVGWVLSVGNSDRVLVGLRSGIALIDAFDDSARLEWIDRRFPADPDQRLNDAKVDRAGRVWCGSMSATDQSRSVGCLARYEVNKGVLVIVDRGYRVTNGPAFNSDCTVMLHSDSVRRITYRFQVEQQTGVATHRSVWKWFPEEEGSPDGMNFDAEDCVWIAHWGAGKVCRYNIEGKRLLTVPVPATNVTNVCFGGKDLNRLFVTSASVGLENPEPGAGDLFEVCGLDVKGLAGWQPCL